MLLRVSHPGRPTVLKDLGQAHGERHLYQVMRRTIDDDRTAARFLRFAAAQGRTTNVPLEVHR